MLNENEHTEREDGRFCGKGDPVAARGARMSSGDPASARGERANKGEREGKGDAARAWSGREGKSEGANARVSRPSTSRVANAARYGAAVAFWIVLWIALALLVGNPILLAGPGETLTAFFGSFTQPSFWSAVGQTTARVVGVGLASAVLATVLGFIAARFSWVRVLLAPAMQVMKSAPVACIIVIVLVAAGAVGALVSIVAFVTIPPFYVAALEAQQARNDATERVLRLAGLSAPRVFLASTWPSMLPYFSAAAKTAIGLSWKAGITAELLCIPLGSIGAAVYGAKLTLDTPALLMWTIVVMLLGWANEKLAVALLDATRKSPTWAVGSRTATDEPGAQDAANARNPQAAQVAAITHDPQATQVAAITHDSQSASNTPSGKPPLDVLTLDQVRFSYGDKLVLDDLTLHVPARERVCLMAPTGTGKTTLLSLLTGQHKPQAGSVSAPHHLGVVMQHSTLIDSLSALQNVLLTCGNVYDTHQIERELTALLPEGTIYKPAAELSGGTRRLTEIARALLGSGQAIILDEPFTGLDATANERACTFILKHLEGRPLLFTTHHTEDATRLDAHVALLEDGRIASLSRQRAH